MSECGGPNKAKFFNGVAQFVKAAKMNDAEVIQLRQAREWESGIHRCAAEYATVQPLVSCLSVVGRSRLYPIVMMANWTTTAAVQFELI